MDLAKPWLDDLHTNYYTPFKLGEHEKSAGKTWTLKELGEVLALEIGRPKPFTPNILSRFLNNQQTNLDTLEAFCSFFAIPSPLLTAYSIKEAEWFLLGRMLHNLSPAKFDRFMTAAKAEVAAKIEFQKLDQELGGNPDDSES